MQISVVFGFVLLLYALKTNNESGNACNLIQAFPFVLYRSKNKPPAMRRDPH